MSQSWESYYRDEENRELGKLIKEGFCPECQDEKPSLIYDKVRNKYVCNTCGLLIQG